MHMRTGWILLACMMLVSPPTAFADGVQTADLRFESLQSAVFRVSVDVTGPNATSLRHYLDHPQYLHGNGDGVVDRSEVDAYERAMVDAGVPENRRYAIRLDERPYGVRVTSFRSEGLVATLVDSTAPILTVMEGLLELEGPPTEGRVHVLTSTPPPVAGGSVFAHVVPPPGHAVGSRLENVQRLGPCEAVVPLTQQGFFLELNQRENPCVEPASGGANTPGFGILVALVALGVIGRRRRPAVAIAPTKA